MNASENGDDSGKGGRVGRKHTGEKRGGEQGQGHGEEVEEVQEVQGQEPAAALAQTPSSLSLSSSSPPPPLISPVP